MKLAIVGTRNPGISYKEWEQRLLQVINVSEVTLIISGGAKGVDFFAKKFAALHKIPYMEFAPQYSVYGRRATLVRNLQIVTEASTVIAFPSDESRGTYHTIREAQRLQRRVIVEKI